MSDYDDQEGFSLFWQAVLNREPWAMGVIDGMARDAIEAASQAWQGMYWTVREDGQTLGLLQFYQASTGYDPETGQFDADDWERRSRKLFFPLTRDGWKAAHRRAREIAARDGGPLTLDSYADPDRRLPGSH